MRYYKKLTPRFVFSFLKKVIKRFMGFLKIRDFVYIIFLPFKRCKINYDENSFQNLVSVYENQGGGLVRKNELVDIKYDLKIIVPAYNVKEYLDDCMQSILSQKTKYNYHIVLIDDGSTDGTSEIADNYKNNPKVEVIHQENKGLSGARNVGLKTIDSKYICFVDSDDLMAPNFIEVFVNQIITEECDIVEGGFYNLIGDTLIFHHSFSHKVITESHTRLTGFACGKIFKSSLFANFIFPEHFCFEDTSMRLNVFHFTKKILLLPNIAYYYRLNPQSITATCKKQTIRNLDTVYITKKLFDARELLGIRVTSTYIEDLLNQFVVNYKRTSSFDEHIKKAVFQISKDMLNEVGEDFKIKRHKLLYKAFSKNDYGAYLWYMRTH